MAHYEAFAFIAGGFAKLAMQCVMLKRLTEPKPMSERKVLSSGSDKEPREGGGSSYPGMPVRELSENAQLILRSMIFLKCRPYVYVTVLQSAGPAMVGEL